MITKVNMDRSRLLLLTLLLSMLATLSQAVDEKCPGAPQCICKWSGGKRLADCTNAGFSSVPDKLEETIQAIILDGNPISRLEKDAFKSAGLVNLQKIVMKNCGIKYVDEFAFRDLKILMEVDLSNNNITNLKTKTFDGNDGLKILILSSNPVTALNALQFPPLRNLKQVDFSFCNLEVIDPKAFHNLGASLENVALNNNRLKHLDVDSFTGLPSLKTLQLHNNPWLCDCKLTSFRDWLMRKGLYARPTACIEPSRLHDKLWDEITPGDFACKPDIIIPLRFVFGSPGANVTLPCQITGSPAPQVRWVVNGRIVNNNTSPAPFSDQRWIIKEMSTSSNDNFRRWYNLTVTNSGYDNLGDYVCVAENNGGVMEKMVTLTFDDPATISNRGSGAGGIPSDQWTVIVGATTAGVVFLGLMILLCCCCLCRKKKTAEKKNAKGNENAKTLKENGSAISAYGNETSLMSNMNTQQTLDFGDESEALLLQHHLQRGYNPNMMMTPRTNESSTSSGVTPEPHYIPDLLEASNLTRAMSSPLNQNTLPSRKTSTPLSVVNLMQNSPGSASFHRSGTLPLPHHYHYHHNHSHNTLGHHTPQGRSISCDHSNGGKPMHQHARQMQLPAVHYHHPLDCHVSGHAAPASNKHPRPGYVTLPRRPRASWSAPPPPQGMCRDTPSPCLSQFRTEFREPIYDGVGPRTSADGSSKASLNTTTLPRNQHLNKSFDNSSFGVRTPLSSGNGYTLPPYYAPIEEVQECPPTPKERPRSTPNILDFSDPEISAKFNTPKEKKSSQNNGKGPNSDLHNNNDSSVGTSCSEITLIEENISGYCEPFGKAVLPQDEEMDSRPVTMTPTRSSVATYSSAGSELEFLIPQKQDQQRANQNQSPNSCVDAQIAGRHQVPQPAARKQVAHPQELGQQQQRGRKVSPSSSGQSPNELAYRNQKTDSPSSMKIPPQPLPKKVSLSDKHDLQNGSRPQSGSSNQFNNNTSSSPSPNTSIDNSSIDVMSTTFNGNGEGDGVHYATPNKKVPPKTLPKPKVRPVPPPKPKKSAIWVPPPLIGNSFQDEGADGSEV